MGELLKKRGVLVPPCQAHPTETCPWVKPITGSTFSGGKGSVCSNTPPPFSWERTCSHRKSWEGAWREISGLTTAGETEGRGWAESWEVKQSEGPSRDMLRGGVLSSLL